MTEELSLSTCFGTNAGVSCGSLERPISDVDMFYHLESLGRYGDSLQNETASSNSRENEYRKLGGK